jgi:hypothetical protein
MMKRAVKELAEIADRSIDALVLKRLLEPAARREQDLFLTL